MPCFIFHSNKVCYNKVLKLEFQKILGVLKVQLRGGGEESLLFIAGRTFHQFDPETSWILDMSPILTLCYVLCVF